jgi:hypothetical protein
LEYRAVVCKSQYGIPVRELWHGLNPSGFEKGEFAMLRGYMDESGDGANFFTLSCLVSSGENWDELETDWTNCIESKNVELRKNGRKIIHRYHAADCSSCLQEFEGWSVPEQIEFVKALFAVFNRFRFNVHSYGVNLREMIEEIPITEHEPVGFAYVTLLMLILLDIAEQTLENNPGELIRLFHDHCDYDGALIQTFNSVIDDPDLKNGYRFVGLSPERWQFCVPLQPADMIAYENHKALEREYDARFKGKPRASLLSLIKNSQVAGDPGHFNRANLKAMKKIIDSLDEYSREMLLAMARIKDSKSV